MNALLRKCLMESEKPSRYVGGEVNAPVFREGVFSFCMCFPEVYEVGMSNLGTKIVAKSMENAGFGVDWCFAPWPDFGDKLKEHGIPLASLHAKKPLASFDMVAFSLGFELSYTNMLYMLDLAQIPLLRREREGKNYPVIACGGPCCVNPAPLCDFVDLFFIGDGEEVDAEVGRLYEESPDRETFLQKAAEIRGVFVPKYPKERVRSALVEDLDKAIYPESFMVPNCEAVHDRAVIEVMRGCYRGCRFCQAGFLYRPVRARSVETLTRQAKSIIESTGYDELSMNSLSTGDYPHLRELIRSLKRELPDVDLAFPSLRVDSFDAEFAQDSRKSSLTFAPEAGTQRLRDVINKDVTLEEILHAASSAFDLGYSSVKLYFMFGLPTETDEDLLGIADIATKISELYYTKKRKKSLRISISASTFIPKPFTPFQWERQASEEEVKHKLSVLKSSLRMRGVTLSWNDFFTSRLEACLARGDERMGEVIAEAYRQGARFDSWMEHFQPSAWQRAFEACGVDPERYTREWSEEERLPWEFVDIGVSREFFLREKHRAYENRSTGGCLQGCKGCGLQEVCPKGKEL